MRMIRYFSASAGSSRRPWFCLHYHNHHRTPSLGNDIIDGIRRRLSSSAASANQNQADDNDHRHHQFDFRASRLGLVPRFVNPCLGTILQLPEVGSAVEILQGAKKTKAPSSSSPHVLEIDDLERACQVLESMSKGGKEHQASLALKAELQQRLGMHQAAHQSVCDLENWIIHETDSNEGKGQTTPTSPNPSRIEISLAKAKTAWYTGDFALSKQLCDDAMEENDDIYGLLPLHYAALLSGYGMASMLQCKEDDLDDAFTVRDPCRMSLKFLEKRKNRYYTAYIAAHLNMGVSEVVYANTVGKARNVSVPFDPALRVWSEGLTLLQTGSSFGQSPIGKAITAALEVRLETNMAWGILKIDDGMDDIIPESLEHAGKALSRSDSTSTTSTTTYEKEYLRRILTVLATCYHKAGKAVTAEGLLQSATTLPSLGDTLTKLDERNSFGCYSALCKDWDKRQSDADRMRSKANELNLELPTPWQGKEGIYSSLWFWTPGEFYY